MSDRKDLHHPKRGSPTLENESAEKPSADRAEESTALDGVDASPLAPLSREEVETLRRENDDLRDQLLRKRAEFENYRKRIERDRHQEGVDAVAGLLRSLIPTLDNLDRALEVGGAEATLQEGVALIRRDLLALLEAQGVVVQEPKGERFDPQIHQALSHEFVHGVAGGTIIEVFRKGYRFQDRLLRPALVKVAKDEDAPEKVH